jgi:tetraacyldisaccharide-1-P 4'-kinase
VDRTRHRRPRDGGDEPVRIALRTGARARPTWTAAAAARARRSAGRCDIVGLRRPACSITGSARDVEIE